MLNFRAFKVSFQRVKVQVKFNISFRPFFTIHPLLVDTKPPSNLFLKNSSNEIDSQRSNVTKYLYHLRNKKKMEDITTFYRKEIAPHSFLHTQHIFDHILRVCCQLQRYDMLDFFIDEATKYKINLTPNIFSQIFTSLSSLGPSSKEKILKTYEKMKSIGLEPNSHTFTILFEYFSRENMKDLFIWTYEEFKKNRLTMDTLGYNLMLNNLAKHSMVKEMYALFQQMKEDKIDCDIYTYHSLIQAAGRLKQPETLKKILEEMKNNSFKFNIKTYNHILQAYHELEDIPEVLRYYNEIISSGIQPSTVTYTIILAALIRARDWKSFKALEVHIFENQSALSVPLLSVLVDGYRGMRDLNNLNNVLPLAKKLNFGINRILVNKLIQAYLNIGKVNLAIELFDVLTDENIGWTLPTLRIFLSHIQPEDMPKELHSEWKRFKISTTPDDAPFYLPEKEISPFVKFLTSIYEFNKKKKKNQLKK